MFWAHGWEEPWNHNADDIRFCGASTKGSAETLAVPYTVWGIGKLTVLDFV